VSDQTPGPDAPDPRDQPDVERTADRDGEPTQPITGVGWTSPSDSHQPPPVPAESLPAQNPQPAYRPSPSPIPPQQSPWGPPFAQPGGQAGYGSGAPTTPMPLHRSDEVRGRVPRWVWPVVAVLSLLVGLMGGFLGALGYDRWDDNASTYDDGLAAVQTKGAAPLDADNGSVPAVAQALLPSTVQIVAAFDGEDEGATGSGFVLDREGHVVTNNHVVQSAAEDDGPIKVVDFEGVRHDATVVGRSAVYDLAILKVADADDLEPAALGASTVLHVGDPVVAFGSPLGLSQTVTSGIVSALNRPVTTGDEDNVSSYINAVQTDAAINPGNSGGPLVNLAGAVVGVNSAIATTGGSGLSGGAGNIGVGFAIPIEQVKTTADQILRTGEARYPVIGAQVRTGGADATGALITEVNKDAPADAAGLLKDDVVTEVDGKPVTDGIALIVAIRTHQPGDTIEFTVVRGGSEKAFKVTLDGEVG
jgi:putative serine protease PepD